MSHCGVLSGLNPCDRNDFICFKRPPFFPYPLQITCGRFSVFGLCPCFEVTQCILSKIWLQKMVSVKTGCYTRCYHMFISRDLTHALRTIIISNLSSSYLYQIFHLQPLRFLPSLLSFFLRSLLLRGEYKLLVVRVSVLYLYPFTTPNAVLDIRSRKYCVKIAGWILADLDNVVIRIFQGEVALVYLHW